MITISPSPYVPFKKRVKRAFIGLLALTIFMGIFIGSVNASSTYHPQPQQGQMDPTLKIELIAFMASVIFLLFGVVILCQVWVLDSIIIDEKRKKIKVLTRKLDELIDKGEFDIDDNLKIKISSKGKNGGMPIDAL